MSFQRENTTPQPTPGHSCNYLQVADDALVVLTDDSTDTECEKNAEKTCWREEAEQKEREAEAERRGGSSEEEGGGGRGREAEAERGSRGGREAEEEPETPLEGPSGVSSWWTEWEREQQLQAVERYVAAHEKAATAFERMAKAAERTADEWGMYHAWAEWAEMRRREDVREARMAELERTGRGWKRPQSEVAEDKNEEADEGVEGDNEEEEEVGGEKEGGEEQEGGGGHVMEE
ncbi:hypothetical protein M404DRAFT_34423 [Pisolithus tinctorius Marx 270]|uniref:Uncharacterized protein n=1 Tax=Pisolithus tinctorius Marx 270 TaxID=870435 RepID=A0A0C3NHG8_PISTI|nr:hypothetical protein M404DRAFT_34423 [Pisolithus tinctorius Marx 270]